MLAGVLALYLTSGDKNFVGGWLWEVYDNYWQMSVDVIAFCLVEFLVLLVLLWRADARIVRDPFFLTGLIVLLIPLWYYLYYFGQNYNSELYKRVVMPTVMMLAWFAARVVVGGTRPAAIVPRTRGVVIVLIIGAFSSTFALNRAISGAGVFRYERVEYPPIRF